MTTRTQLMRKKRGKKASRGTRTPSLEGRPQVRGVCRKVYTMTPKKPNSAQRTVVSLKRSNGSRAIAYIPGEGGSGLQEHSTVLVRGGRVRDLPGIYYKVVRGAMDTKGVPGRVTSRSKYGVKKVKDEGEVKAIKAKKE